MSVAHLVNLRTQMQKQLEQHLLRVHEQREEIITAFIAKYGCSPNEIEQVEEHFKHGRVITWYVRKRDTKEVIQPW